MWLLRSLRKEKDCSDSLIVLMHSEHFYSGLDTSELISPPPSNIIFNKMTVEGNEGKLSNCEMSKVSSESKAWMWCICSVVPRSVARIRGNKWGVTASWRKSWAHRLAFISLRGPGELDQLTTFPQVGRRPPEFNYLRDTVGGMTENSENYASLVLMTPQSPFP